MSFAGLIFWCFSKIDTQFFSDTNVYFNHLTLKCMSWIHTFIHTAQPQSRRPPLVSHTLVGENCLFVWMYVCLCMCVSCVFMYMHGLCVDRWKSTLCKVVALFILDVKVIGVHFLKGVTYLCVKRVCVCLCCLNWQRAPSTIVQLDMSRQCYSKETDLFLPVLGCLNSSYIMGVCVSPMCYCLCKDLRLIWVYSNDIFDPSKLLYGLGLDFSIKVVRLDMIVFTVWINLKYVILSFCCASSLNIFE